MAKTGRVKWEHYFKGRTIDTFVKANSKATETKNKTSTGVTLAHGTPITVFGGDIYETKLQIGWGNNQTGELHIDCIDKPGKTNVRMQIEATKLISLGHDMVIPSILGIPDVKCKCFKTPKEIALSVIHGLENEPSVPDYVTEQLLDYFMDNLDGNYNFTWSRAVVDGIRKQIGTYVGEMLVGYIGLAGASQHMSKNILPKDTECFLVPDDPQFAGVDSLFLAKDGTQVPVSSKYGRGALASVWANIIPVAIKYKSTLRDCVLKDLVTAAEAVGGDPARKGKEIVYEYGIKKILEVDTDKPYEVFKAFKAGKPAEHAPVLLKALQYVKSGGDGTESSANVLITNGRKGGKSLTAILSRGIADRLNNDTTSLNEAKRLIAGKDFYQANLDDSKFLKGEVYFRMNKAADMSLSFSGSKASTSNIDASQGTVNYLLA